MKLCTKKLFVIGVCLFTYYVTQNNVCGQDLLLKQDYETILFLGPNNVRLSEFITGINSDNVPLRGVGEYKTYDSSLGDRFGDVFTSYLAMYRATGDKAYLHKFISETYFVQQFRNDLQNTTNHPGWWQINKPRANGSLQDGQEYWDGNTIAPMAEYCFSTQYDTDFTNNNLANTPLPLAGDLDIADPNKWPPTSISTYGEYATWLAMRVEETLNWYLGDRYTNIKGIYHKTQPTQSPLQINQQANFATALFFLGAYAGNSTYLDKAKILAQKYKGKTAVFKDTGITGADGVTLCAPQIDAIFQLYNSATMAYRWHHNGWEAHSLPEHDECDGVTANGLWEDIGHGSLTLSFPMAIANYQEQFWGQTVFTVTDMQRFANTLTQLHYYNDGGNPNFYHSVNTRDNGCAVCLKDSSKLATESNRTAALAWARLAEYDINPTTPSRSVYTLLKLYYAQTLDGQNNNATAYILEGNRYKGLAYLTELQWKRECPNLTMYNRKLTYNQDFYSKADIIIEPYANPNAPSYAEPSITSKTFTTENGTYVNMVAGNKVILKPGFKAKAGSHFRAYIDPLLSCPVMRTATSEMSTEVNTAKRVTYNQVMQRKASTEAANLALSEEAVLFSIYPNPNNGSFTLALPEQEQATIVITNMVGAVVLQTQTIEKAIQLNLTNFGKGIYMVEARQGEQVYREKVVYQ